MWRKGELYFNAVSIGIANLGLKWWDPFGSPNALEVGTVPGDVSVVASISEPPGTPRNLAYDIFAPIHADNVSRYPLRARLAEGHNGSGNIQGSGKTTRGIPA